VNDPDSVFTWSNGIGDDLPELLLGYNDRAAVEDRPSVGLPGGLISLAFVTAALKRRAWLWCLTAVLGLLIGSGLYVKYPPAFHASAQVLLVDSPSQDPATQINNDQAMAQSQAVAALVVAQLGLRQTVGSFQAASTVELVSDNVLLFNVGAPSANDAVVRVTAMATEFLKFRAQYEQAAEQQELSTLDQQFSQAQQSLDSINAQISQVPTGPSSATQQAELVKLETQRTEEDQVEQYVTSTKATTETTTSAMVNDSRLLGAAIPIPRSHVKGVALYIAGGLLGGLAAGAAIVIVAALVSDRLRRRDDVAEAAGAPVRLSVGTLRKRRLPGRPGRAAKRDRDLRRIVAYLRGTVPGRSRGSASPAGLAVVAVDNARDVAPAVVSLAVSCANDGRQVVLADLADGALVRLLGAKGPGIHPVTVGGQHMTAVVPDRDDITRAGPLQTRAQQAPVSEALVTACASADLLLTLATLDPAFGGDHLATWATDAVAVVTAGRSSAVRINAVGEMVRLAGTRLDSVVLVGAEKSDESLGATLTSEEPSRVGLD
jgi:capsular polysaccharide biosynthesis protein